MPLPHCQAQAPAQTFGATSKLAAVLMLLTLFAASCGSNSDTAASPSPFPTVPPANDGGQGDPGGDAGDTSSGSDGSPGDETDQDSHGSDTTSDGDAETGEPPESETNGDGSSEGDQDDGFILQLPTAPAGETDTDSPDGTAGDTDGTPSSTSDQADTDPPAAPTPTPLPAPPTCAAEAPIEPARSTSVSLDWDGDGEDDIVQVYGLGQLDAPDWRVRVETASGSMLDSPLQVEDGSRANVSVVGGADVDGDAATDEAFVVVGAGAAASIVTIVNQSGCDIVPVTLNGAPISFPIGGSALNIGGLTCEDSDNNGVNNSFWAWIGTSADGENWLIDGVQFELRGTELTQLDATSFEASTSEPSFNYPFLTCGDISWI